MEESLNCDHLERNIHLSLLYQTLPCTISLNKQVNIQVTRRPVNQLPCILNSSTNKGLAFFILLCILQRLCGMKAIHVIIELAFKANCSFLLIWPLCSPWFPNRDGLRQRLLWVPLWKVMPRMTDWQVEVFSFFWGRNISRVMLLVFAKSPESSREWRVKIDFLLMTAVFLTGQSRRKGRWRLRSVSGEKPRRMVSKQEVRYSAVNCSW